MSVAEKAEKALKMVESGQDIVYDVETSGLDWKRNFPVGYVIGTGGPDAPIDVVYVPVRHGGGGNLPGAKKLPTEATGAYDIHPFEDALSKAFAARPPLARTIGHHIKFDAHFSANTGVMLGRNLSCTQTNQALIDEYTSSFSLDGTSNYHGVTCKLAQPMYDHIGAKFNIPATRDSMGRYWELPGDDRMATEYAEGDGVSTMEVFHKQLVTIDEQKLRNIWDVENDLIWTLFKLERRGIKVDTAYLEELLQTIQGRVEAAYRVLPPDFNARSPIQVKAYVEQFATDWPTTPKGNPSFAEKWLETFPEGHNIVALRKWTNLANTFVTPLLEQHVYEGRVHATLNQNKADEHGTVSGRLSCSAPNLQQIPKHDRELSELFRKAFLPDEGMLFYEGDYSQCEPRLFAHYSQEPALLEGYNQTPPRDVHTVVAELFNADRETKAKRMNMGMFTGMFPKSFAGHLGVPLEEATALWNQWFEEFPAIKSFQGEVKNLMNSRGYVRTKLGRRGRLESRKYAYRGVSKLIQGNNADIIKYKMVEIDKMMEGVDDNAQLLLSVHDSMVWQAKDSELGREVSEAVRSIMEDLQTEPFGYRVPFPVDLKRGATWAEASFGKKI